MVDTDYLAVLQDVQSQLAFQEDTIAALNEALATQQREIIVLQRQLALLKQTQDEHAATLEEIPGATEPPPPHY